MKFLGIILLFIGIWTATVAGEKIIYLSPNGQDANPGTKEKPLASLTGARDLIREFNTPDTVLVKIAPGEWLLKNDGYLYYIPMVGEQIESASAFIPIIEKFITIKGDKGNPVKNKKFKNISFKVAAYRTPKQGNNPMQAVARVALFKKIVDEKEK